MATTTDKTVRRGRAERTRRTTRDKTGHKSERGTGAALREGAKSRTAAHDDQTTRKELTRRGGPGPAGTSPTKTKRAHGSKAGKLGTASKRIGTRGRGVKAHAGS